ncbi:vacuolar protein-sorting-associated protein 36 [Anopheles aquasalis]|uniref:vacuolar protein-sorting-associated protein 36 n=1 Tax=Anopheles aquasalis TaxID=42839 RepID=UPI00215AAB61|nr:vacuolar protein-sorting-associated protein 36 [Anopheles aquasalis]XP_050089752.1 vacuolar protein-sorting-associated protein 36 [Anopheles aquasalis]XP_050089753.1 vacuolar protein-sorting-associated protein 36 [Anopheles aquasalis]XP_050089755.1 vacuolar protein-sorting-associated protein 36 [Anopheles aquasalis]
MNRFEYCQARLWESEEFIAIDRNIKLYNGNEKTSYDDGELILTSHRLLWGRNGELARGENVLSLRLLYVTSLEQEEASSMLFGKKKRIILRLGEVSVDKAPGPMDNSIAHFVKISGRNGVSQLFVESLKATISARVWAAITADRSVAVAATATATTGRTLRTGIGGIERSLAEKQKQTDKNISIAFQDLDKLMEMAKDMVAVTKVVSSKIRERHGEVSEDETVRFKSYLMSLGIDDPVTRDGTRSSSEYFMRLSQQLCEMLLDPITEAGGMMSLADVYCRVNRARGLELLSPEDVLNACKLLIGPITLRSFPSGAMVLQLETHDDALVSQRTCELVNQHTSISTDELARCDAISLILAKERLLAAESLGYLCRDESIEGLRFYGNRFIQ